MKYNYLNNSPLDEAKKIYFEHLKEVGFGAKSETVSVSDACGRIIKSAAYAHICSPHYNASATDGIALKAEITFSASENTPVVLSQGEYNKSTRVAIALQK